MSEPDKAVSGYRKRPTLNCTNPTTAGRNAYKNDSKDDRRAARSEHLRATDERKVWVTGEHNCGATAFTTEPLFQVVPTTAGSPSKGIIKITDLPADDSSLRKTRDVGSRGNSTTSKLSDIEECEEELTGTLLRWNGDSVKFKSISKSCERLQRLWRELFTSGVEIPDANRIWQKCHYLVIEAVRRLLGRKSKTQDTLQANYSEFLTTSTSYYCQLIDELMPSDSPAAAMNHQLRRREKLCVLACHHFNIFAGDLCRYRQQLALKPDWNEPRNYYLKAQQLAPKNGKPYNQLAVIAIHAHRRLDAVYYYIRSLMATNPFQSAKESLSGLFDDTSRKAEKGDERLKRDDVKRKRLKDIKQRRSPRLASSTSSNEIWILPWERASQQKSSPLADAEATDKNNEQSRQLASTLTGLSQQPLTAESVKTFTSLVLISHGKLFTKIGLERIAVTMENCYSVWRSILHCQLGPADCSRFLKVLTISLFSIHNSASREQVSSPAYTYFCGMATSFVVQFVLEELKVCSHILHHHHTVTDDSSALVTQASESQTIVDKDVVDQRGSGLEQKLADTIEAVSCHLPLVNVWFVWLESQLQLWSSACAGVKPSLLKEFWSAAERLLNQLNQLEACILPYNTTEVILWEEKSLSGFMPLTSLTHSAIMPGDKDKSQDAFLEGLWRVQSILQTSRKLCTGTCLPLVWRCDEKCFAVREEFVAVDMQEDTVVDDRDVDSHDASSSSDDVIVEEQVDDNGDGKIAGEDLTKTAGSATLSDIERLRLEKERLTRRLETQQQTQRDVQDLLKSRTELAADTGKTVVPRYIVPDTNCFIDNLTSVQTIASSGHFTLAIPLTVLLELEGLMKGSEVGASSTALMAKKAVGYLRQRFEAKDRFTKLLTTKGNFLTSALIQSEQTGIQISNDDYILLSSINLHNKVDGYCSGDESRPIYSVALLTDDRNLRVKAYAQDFPVKTIEEFMRWCKL